MRHDGVGCARWMWRADGEGVRAGSGAPSRGRRRVPFSGSAGLGSRATPGNPALPRRLGGAVPENGTEGQGAGRGCTRRQRCAVSRSATCTVLRISLTAVSGLAVGGAYRSQDQRPSSNARSPEYRLSGADTRALFLRTVRGCRAAVGGAAVGAVP